MRNVLLRTNSQVLLFFPHNWIPDRDMPFSEGHFHFWMEKNGWRYNLAFFRKMDVNVTSWSRYLQKTLVCRALRGEINECFVPEKATGGAGGGAAARGPSRWTGTVSGTRRSVLPLARTRVSPTCRGIQSRSHMFFLHHVRTRDTTRPGDVSSART